METRTNLRIHLLYYTFYVSIDNYLLAYYAHRIYLNVLSTLFNIYNVRYFVPRQTTQRFVFGKKTPIIYWSWQLAISIFCSRNSPLIKKCIIYYWCFPYIFISFCVLLVCPKWYTKYLNNFQHFSVVADKLFYSLAVVYTVRRHCLPAFRNEKLLNSYNYLPK